MKHLISVCLFLLTLVSYAQCLSGSYTIGGTAPDYASLQQAFDAMENNGVCGATVFYVQSGVYTGRAELNNYSNTSPVNVLFISLAADSTAVRFTANGSSNADSNYVIKLNNVVDVTFSHLGFENINSGNLPYGGVFKMEGTCEDVRIHNCHFKALENWTHHDLIYIDADAMLYWLKVENSRFEGGSVGINLNKGNAGLQYLYGPELLGNELINQNNSGIHIRRAYDYLVEDCRVESNTNKLDTLLTDPVYHAVYIDSCSGGDLNRLFIRLTDNAGYTIPHFSNNYDKRYTGVSWKLNKQMNYLTNSQVIINDTSENIVLNEYCIVYDPTNQLVSGSSDSVIIANNSLYQSRGGRFMIRYPDYDANNIPIWISSSDYSWIYQRFRMVNNLFQVANGELDYFNSTSVNYQKFENNIFDINSGFNDTLNIWRSRVWGSENRIQPIYFVDSLNDLHIEIDNGIRDRGTTFSYVEEDYDNLPRDLFLDLGCDELENNLINDLSLFALNSSGFQNTSCDDSLEIKFIVKNSGSNLAPGFYYSLTFKDTLIDDFFSDTLQAGEWDTIMHTIFKENVSDDTLSIAVDSIYGLNDQNLLNNIAQYTFNGPMSGAYTIGQGMDFPDISDFYNSLLYYGMCGSVKGLVYDSTCEFIPIRDLPIVNAGDTLALIGMHDSVVFKGSWSQFQWDLRWEEPLVYYVENISVDGNINQSIYAYQNDIIIKDCVLDSFSVISGNLYSNSCIITNSISLATQHSKLDSIYNSYVRLLNADNDFITNSYIDHDSQRGAYFTNNHLNKVSFFVISRDFSNNRVETSIYNGIDYSVIHATGCYNNYFKVKTGTSLTLASGTDTVVHNSFIVEPLSDFSSFTTNKGSRVFSNNIVVYKNPSSSVEHPLSNFIYFINTTSVHFDSLEMDNNLYVYDTLSSGYSSNFSTVFDTLISINLENNSKIISSLPFMADSLHLQPNQWTVNQGKELFVDSASVIRSDIDGNYRPFFRTDIGPDEISFNGPIDLELVEIVDDPFCYGDSLIGRVKNHNSMDTAFFFFTYLQQDGQIDSLLHIETISPGDTTEVYFGLNEFNNNGSNSLKIWTSLPNDKVDTVHSNDTLIYNYNSYSYEAFGYSYSCMNNDSVTLFLDSVHLLGSYTWFNGSLSDSIRLERGDTAIVQGAFLNGCLFDDTTILTISDFTLPDVVKCPLADSSIVLPDGFFSAIWDDTLYSDTLIVYLPVESHTVIGQDYFGCVYSDTFDVSQVVNLDLIPFDDTTVCELVFRMDNPYHTIPDITNVQFSHLTGTTTSLYIDHLLYNQLYDSTEYTVLAQETNYNCWVEDTYTVIPRKANMTLTAAPCYGQPALWESLDSGAIGYLVNMVSSTNPYEIYQNGVYEMRVKITNSCFAFDSIHVNNYPQPDSVTINVDSSDCAIIPTILSVPNSYVTYYWNDVLGDSLYYATESGWYILECFDSYGCGAVDSVYVSTQPSAKAIDASLFGSGGPGSFLFRAEFENANSIEWVFGNGTSEITQTSQVDTFLTLTRAFDTGGTFGYYFVAHNECNSDTSNVKQYTVAFAGVDDQSNQQISLIPNPVESGAGFVIRSSVDIDRILIYDQLGKIVYDETHKPGNMMIGDDWDEGVYYIELYLTSKDLVRKKLVILK